MNENFEHTNDLGYILKMGVSPVLIEFPLVEESFTKTIYQGTNSKQTNKNQPTAAPNNRGTSQRKENMSTNATMAGPKTQRQKHNLASKDEWLAARKELLQAEKELTRRSDELAKRRQDLPWVRMDKKYRFDTDEGTATLADLFKGRSQLLVYHFMFGPDYQAGCPSCSSIADGFNGIAVHLANHDVMLWAVSRAPLAKLQAYKRRMGWTFPWASSFGSDFNYDFHVSFTEEQERKGAEYNFQIDDPIESDAPVNPESGSGQCAKMAGVDQRTYSREAPGMSSFILEDGAVYHTYSAYSRGVDSLWGMYQWLDRAPKGRNETGIWWRLHDEYGTAAQKSGCCH